MNERYKTIVIIDDDDCNNMIFKITIKNLCKPLPIDIRDFLHPMDGLAYLEKEVLANQKPVVLFLDINMPVMNGWEVLERLNLFPQTAKPFLKVFMFSSSMDSTDRNRAIADPMVHDYIIKPLNTTMTWLKNELLEVQSASY